MSKIRLTESQLHRVIKESVMKILRETNADPDAEYRDRMNARNASDFDSDMAHDYGIDDDGQEHYNPNMARWEDEGYTDYDDDLDWTIDSRADNRDEDMDRDFAQNNYYLNNFGDETLPYKPQNLKYEYVKNHPHEKFGEYMPPYK